MEVWTTGRLSVDPVTEQGLRAWPWDQTTRSAAVGCNFRCLAEERSLSEMEWEESVGTNREVYPPVR